ncbi:hypothetical protein DXG01_005178 [Tephrocybe rancida]|nr:hypothetical protein DXG01_005178 [Tephrocybe rancida]
MPAVIRFDTEKDSTIRRMTDIHAIQEYPRPFVAPPRFAHGFSRLDISNGANIRVKSTVSDVTKNKADFQVISWDDTQLFGCIQSVFALAPGNLQFSTGEHMRNLKADPESPSSVRINFDRPFVTPPKVVVFFNHLDFEKGKAWRLITSATAIDAMGFTLNIETWYDTVLHAAQASWIAYPEDTTHIYSTSVNTGPGEVHVSNRPQARQSNSEIVFGDVGFCRDPDVFVAFNTIDIDSDANLRVVAYVDNVSREGLTWHIDSWDDTVLYSAGVSIVAFNEFH